jgi:hypothetical protein
MEAKRYRVMVHEVTEYIVLLTNDTADQAKGNLLAKHRELGSTTELRKHLEGITDPKEPYPITGSSDLRVESMEDTDDA